MAPCTRFIMPFKTPTFVRFEMNTNNNELKSLRKIMMSNGILLLLGDISIGHEEHRLCSLYK